MDNLSLDDLYYTYVEHVTERDVRRRLIRNSLGTRRYFAGMMALRERHIDLEIVTEDEMTITWYTGPRARRIKCVWPGGKFVIVLRAETDHHFSGDFQLEGSSASLVEARLRGLI